MRRTTPVANIAWKHSPGSYILINCLLQDIVEFYTMKDKHII